MKEGIAGKRELLARRKALSIPLIRSGLHPRNARWRLQESRCPCIILVSPAASNSNPTGQGSRRVIFSRTVLDRSQRNKRNNCGNRSQIFYSIGDVQAVCSGDLLNLVNALTGNPPSPQAANDAAYSQGSCLSLFVEI